MVGKVGSGVSVHGLGSGPLGLARLVRLPNEFGKASARESMVKPTLL